MRHLKEQAASGSRASRKASDEGEGREAIASLGHLGFFDRGRRSALTRQVIEMLWAMGTRRTDQARVT